MDFQARHLFATGMVDDVLVANAYASDEELEACAAVNPSILTFGLVLEKELTETEQKILDYGPKHVVPVSYTHLDVYKRQPLSPGRRGYKTHNRFPWQWWTPSH